MIGIVLCVLSLSAPRVTGQTLRQEPGLPSSRTARPLGGSADGQHYGGADKSQAETEAEAEAASAKADKALSALAGRLALSGGVDKASAETRQATRLSSQHVQHREVLVINRLASLAEELKARSMEQVRKLFFISKDADCEQRNTWRDNNPEFQVVHVYGDDNEAAEFIVDEFYKQNLFGATFSRSEVVKFFLSNNPIELADILRYLLVYLHGGAYVDCDLAPNVPIASWTTAFGYDSDLSEKLSLLAGLEFPWPRDQGGLKSPFQLEQYSFLAKQSSPVLLHVLRTVVNFLEKRMPRKIPAGDPKAMMLAFGEPPGQTHDDFIEAHFGPGMWTAALVDAIAAHGRRPGHASDGAPLSMSTMETVDKKGELLTLTNVEGDPEPAQVLILPYRSFSFHPFHRPPPYIQTRDCNARRTGGHNPQQLAYHQAKGKWRHKGDR